MESFLRLRFKLQIPTYLILIVATFLAASLGSCSGESKEKQEKRRELKELLLQGRNYAANNDFQRAQAVFFNVLDAMDAHDIDDPDIAMYCYNGIGGVCFNSGDTLTSLRYYKEGLKQAEKASDTLFLPKIYSNISLSYAGTKDFGNAEKYNDLLLSTGEVGRSIPATQYIFNSAFIDFQKRNYAKAVSQLRRVEQIDDSIHDGRPCIPDVYFYLARGYFLLDRLDSCSYYIDSFETVMDSVPVSAKKIIYCQHLANYYRAVHSDKKARYYRELALAMRDTMAQSDVRVNTGKTGSVLYNPEQSRWEKLTEGITIAAWILAGIIVVTMPAVLIHARKRRLNRKRRRERERRKREERFVENIEDEVMRDDDDSGAMPEEDSKDPVDEERNAEIMQKLNDYLTETRAYCNAELSIESCARTIGVNKKYLSTAINQTTGDNFRAYLATFRVKEAIEMMTSLKMESRLKIDAIGEKVGFKGCGNFIAAFRKQMGMTPGAYLKSIREAEEPEAEEAEAEEAEEAEK